MSTRGFPIHRKSPKPKRRPRGVELPVDANLLEAIEYVRQGWSPHLALKKSGLLPNHLHAYVRKNPLYSKLYKVAGEMWPERYARLRGSAIRDNKDFETK